jgi:hypothetical protein
MEIQRRTGESICSFRLIFSRRLSPGLFQGSDGAEHQVANARVARYRKMIGVLHQNIGNNFGVLRVFDADVVCGERQKNIAGVEDSSRAYIFGYGVIREAHAVYLQGQFNKNISGAQVACGVQHGPAASAVAGHDDFWSVLQLRGGECAVVRGEMLQDPSETIRSEKWSESGGTDVLKAGTAQDVANLNEAGGFVAGGFERADEADIENAAGGFAIFEIKGGIGGRSGGDELLSACPLRK